MDVMDLRRGLMMAMASGGSILDSLFEIVDSVTATEITYHLEFSNVDKQGAYVIVSNPPGNLDNMLTEQNIQNSGLLNLILIQIIGEPKTVRSVMTTTLRLDYASTGYADYWGGTATINNDVIDIIPCSTSRPIFLPGYTYYLLRVKGM